MENFIFCAVSKTKGCLPRHEIRDIALSSLPLRNDDNTFRLLKLT